MDDIMAALARPGRDPREDLPAPVFKKGILKLEDLQPGMELKGTVLNVVDFGAFVDIGLKDSGLVHISHMANRFIKNPYDIVSVGDVVAIWVLSVDQDRRRVSLTMIRPGTERRHERKPPAPVDAAAAAAVAKPAPRREDRPPGRPQQRAIPGRGQRRPAGAARPAAESPKPAPPPPRKPARARPSPKLTQAALEGAAPLRTFSELMAFYQAKHDEPPAATPPAEPASPPAAEPPPNMPAS
jgi:uncharacterized protein